MPQNNLKQADMPEGCIVLKNDFGTAPGAIIESDKATIIMLPGPPSEMKPMLLNEVRPYLEKFADGVIRSKVLHVFGIGESAAEEKVKSLIDNQTNPTIAPYAKTGETEFRVTAKAKNPRDAEALLKPTLDKLYGLLGDYIYAEGEDASLQKTVVSLLCKHKKTITFAESCTGGMIASRLISVPAVSPQTALEMCRGAKNVSGADIAISITGIAGPGGGTPDKPVGLVYIGICADSVWESQKLILNGSRQSVRERTSLYALDTVRRVLINNDKK